MESSLPNYHLILEGFVRLTRPLVDYEVRILKRQFGKNWWEYGVLRFLKGDYRDRIAKWTEDSDRINNIDTARALILMFAGWEKVFKYRTLEPYCELKNNCYFISSKLFELRNLAAHAPAVDFSKYAAETGLNQMAVLCGYIDPKTAGSIRSLLKEVTDHSRPLGEKAQTPGSPPVSVRGKGSPEGTVVGGQPAPAAKCTVVPSSADGCRDGIGNIAEVVQACIKSADDQCLFDTLLENGKKSHESVVGVESVEISGNDLICTINGAMVDHQEYEVYLNGERLDSEKIEFPYYDRDNSILGISLTEDLIDKVRSCETVDLKLVSDLSFLVRNVHDFYVDYGHRIRCPRQTVRFRAEDIVYPRSPSPTASQREAVETVLNSGFSYVWGAPGTGKTQMTLAAAIISCIRKGQKVAVIAPTNLAVEQVLRGLISAIDNNPEMSAVVNPARDILRMGTATEDFLREYPTVCESRSLAALHLRKQSLYTKLLNIPFERELPAVERKLDAMRIELDRKQRSTDESEISALTQRISDRSREILEVFDRYSKRSELGYIQDLTNRKDIDSVLAYVRNHTTVHRDIAEYLEWTDEALSELLEKIEGEIDAICIHEAMIDNASAKIVACTPHIYLSRFIPKGSVPVKPVFDVDHVFIDEAGYCSAVLALTLFANDVPVTLLGDHKQLPPVCPADQETIDKVKLQYPDYFKDPEFMRYWFLWDMPATYIDTWFTRDMGSIQRHHDEDLPPAADNMVCCSLKESYRFGSNLASILDETVYHNGITGIPGNNLQIEILDVPNPKVPRMGEKKGENRPLRININEAAAIRDYVDNHPMGEKNFCILTPYTDQLKMLNSLIPRLAHRNMITVHRSQGREWDTVILSVQDGTHVLGLDEPLRFTSSHGIGLNLINTAVSRAKQKLIIVCDRQFWSKQGDELITRLIADAKECQISEYTVDG